MRDAFLRHGANTGLRSLDLALIGNCTYGALVDLRGDIVWACMPRFDSKPIFGSLLTHPTANTGLGIFQIELLDLERSEQRYLDNTAILSTSLMDSRGGAIEITDFAPRFKRFGRMFRPLALVRRLKPLAGSPRVCIRVRPTFGYGAGKPAITHGSNHIRYVSDDLVLRLTTDVSITAILDEIPFVLEEELTLFLGPDETVTGAVADVGRNFFEETRNYWLEWVRYLGIPFEWQDAVIRAAITLKLSAYDDTGAIVAAMTTSIPEAQDSGRNWDYRYCWLRDGYFVVNALNRLSATQTMERYLRYIINIAAAADGKTLQPVYRINGRSDLAERIIEGVPGYRGMGPVRIGNDAYRQVQNDVYGSAVLAATHIFFDRRISRPGDESLFRRLEALGHMAVACYDKPDAGLWEFRTSTHVHTFSSVMCWVACDRLAKIAARLGLDEKSIYWRRRANSMHRTISERAWEHKLNTFVESFDGYDLDASLLLLHELGFLAADDPRFVSTVAAVERHLRRGNFIFRYAKEDDFGRPETAFLSCTFWYVDALAAIGRLDEARNLFENLLKCRNSHGLLSEDLNPETGELWGNFPQTYSMVGLINSAMGLSKRWEEAF